MPVICIKSLPLNKPVKINEALRKLNLEVSKATGIEANHIWSYWIFIERHLYAVGDSSAAAIQKQTHSPIVEITGFEGKPDELIEQMLRTTAGVLAQVLEIEVTNIFITYNEVKSGRVFDGGEIITL
jgi:phenylpyruvate tautomerase PptA (4-oxalocrotonate tautomerase family)